MSDTRVLVWTGRDDAALCEKLARLEGVEVVEASPERGELLRQITEAEAFIGQAAHWGRDIATAMANAPKLRWLQLCNAGFDNVERAGVPEHIVVSNMGRVTSEVIAEHAVALLLASMRSVAAFVDATRARQWAPGEFSGRVIPLWKKHVAVLGFGPIGRNIRDRLRAFDAQVTAVARTARSNDDGTEVVPYHGLSQILRKVDALVIACPHKPATIGLVDEHAFAAMKPGGFLVNISRGTIVDTDALIAALDSGRLAGAALDVTDPEPLPQSHALWRCPNLIITPHVSFAGGGAAVRADLESLLIDNVRRFLAGEELPTRVTIDHSQRAPGGPEFSHLDL
ncbi:MAG TPA: D-2-hydroxyacid dehydrogenase [Gammaproteobacteria bacterium]|nr:D-2-hydroxyacid dehydrogenase [Gammaproteobacteria bacterium]